MESPGFSCSLQKWQFYFLLGLITDVWWASGSTLYPNLFIPSFRNEGSIGRNKIFLVWVRDRVLNMIMESGQVQKKSGYFSFLVFNDHSQCWQYARKWHSQTLFLRMWVATTFLKDSLTICNKRPYSFHTLWPRNFTARNLSQVCAWRLSKGCSRQVCNNRILETT